VRVPLSVHVEPLPATPDIVALLYGPLVLAGELGREGLDGLSPYVARQTDHVHVPTPNVPALVAEPQDVVPSVQRVPESPLAFRTVGIGRPKDVTLIPLHRTHRQRYTVYWNLFTPGGWDAYQSDLAAAEVRARERARRVLDFVRIGDADSEKRHKLSGERTQAGVWQSRMWRHAVDGGWFSYEIAVAPSRDTVLEATFWGDDAGTRTFDIVVDDNVLATQTLDRNAPGQFFQVQWPLTKEVIGDKTAVTVRFQAHPGQMAGGLFGLTTVKSAD